MKKIISCLLGFFFLLSSTLLNAQQSQKSDIFTNSVDSLYFCKSEIDSLLQKSHALLSRQIDRLNTFNDVCDWFNSNHGNPLRIDSMNHYLAFMGDGIKETNVHSLETEKKIDFFNKLLPRVSDRLESSVNKDDSLTDDWNNYIYTHNSFADWGNYMIQTFNSVGQGLNEVNNAINQAIDDFNAKNGHRKTKKI